MLAGGVRRVRAANDCSVYTSGAPVVPLFLGFREIETFYVWGRRRPKKGGTGAPAPEILTWTAWLAEQLRLTNSPYLPYYHPGLENKSSP